MRVEIPDDLVAHYMFYVHIMPFLEQRSTDWPQDYDLSYAGPRQLVIEHEDEELGSAIVQVALLQAGANSCRTVCDNAGFFRTTIKFP